MKLSTLFKLAQAKYLSATFPGRPEYICIVVAATARREGGTEVSKAEGSLSCIGKEGRGID